MPIFKVKCTVNSYMQQVKGYGKYHDDASYEDVIRYCFNPQKLAGWGGRAVNPGQAAMEFQKLAKAYDKDYGVRLRHFVISFSEREANCLGYDIYDYLNCFAEYVMDYYGNEYQIIYALHRSRKNPHIHFVMNTVNYKTGEKYRGDKQDYYAFQEYLRSFVRKYFGMELTVVSDDD